MAKMSEILNEREYREQADRSARKLATWTLRTAPEVVDGTVKRSEADHEVRLIIDGFDREFSGTAKHALAVYEVAMSLFMSREYEPTESAKQALDEMLATIESNLA